MDDGADGVVVREVFQGVVRMKDRRGAEKLHGVSDFDRLLKAILLPLSLEYIFYDLAVFGNFVVCHGFALRWMLIS